MELWQEIIIQSIKANMCCNKEFYSELKEIFDTVCYRALKKIKAVLEDDTLEDAECFERIEKIVCVFEEIGFGCEGRHDFG